MTGRIDHKKALLAELLPLMEANGAEPALLDAVRAPGWIEQVTVENLEFLLRQHRELQDLRGRNAGLLARWLGPRASAAPTGRRHPTASCRSFRRAAGRRYRESPPLSAVAPCGSNARWRCEPWRGSPIPGARRRPMGGKPEAPDAKFGGRVRATMGNRMSGRERMERLRAEADAAAKEKEAKAAAKAAGSGSSRSSGKKQPSAQPRVRIVWFVCDASGKEVKHFPYSQEAEARAEAQQMTTSSGRTHFVKTGDIPA